MATSAIWKAMLRPWLMTLAPILMSFSFRLDSDQSLIGSGVASVRGRAALVVESDHPFGRTAHVRHDEADPGIKLARMPLDLGNHPARLAPACRLVGEIGLEPPDFIGRSSDRTLEQVANPTLQAWLAP
jgi:hypothetical protein